MSGFPPSTCAGCGQPIHYGYAYAISDGKLYHDDPCIEIHEHRKSLDLADVPLPNPTKGSE